MKKEIIVNNFKIKHPKLEKDLDFCFEILAGKHKLGYTLYTTKFWEYHQDFENIKTIKQFYNKVLKIENTTDVFIANACSWVPRHLQYFFVNLVNRDYKLGYSNKENMITNLSPMLAKKYPDTFKGEYNYYIQEKLDGNRCIAYYDFMRDMWFFQSRSGKTLNLYFDMSWANTNDIFDGEVMTLAHAGSRDFNRTSGVINSIYGDKSGLHYFIYDIIKEDLVYHKRKCILSDYDTKGTGKDCSILPTLDYITLHPNLDYNWLLNEWLDKITAKGGEGLILRDPNGLYEHKRSNNLLKYKKTQTMDLRIIDWNEGRGKYAGLIGSFVCESDDHEIQVNVAGMTDAVRMSDPINWLNKIIEVAYFDKSRSKDGNYWSLRFPRMKKLRDDKNETSIY